MFNSDNKGKITITIEGLSVHGLGKTTVTAIIMKALKEYGYTINFVAVPGIDQAVAASPGRVDVDTQREVLLINECQKMLQPDNSRPNSFINLIEKV